MRRIIIRLTWIVGLVLVAGAMTAAAWAWHDGVRVYSVRTGSMEPAYRVGDAVLVAPLERAPAVGDVITFHRAGSSDRVTHRVVAIHGAAITTKGDANESADPLTIDRTNIEGTVSHRLPSFGYVFIYLQQPTGIASLLVFALATVMLWQILITEDRPRSADALGDDGPNDPWPELANTLEAVAHSMVGSASSAGAEPVFDPPTGPREPSTAIRLSWSEDLVLALEQLVERPWTLPLGDCPGSH